MSIHGPPYLHFESLNFWIFYFNADPVPASQPGSVMHKSFFALNLNSTLRVGCTKIFQIRNILTVSSFRSGPIPPESLFLSSTLAEGKTIYLIEVNLKIFAANFPGSGICGTLCDCVKPLSLCIGYLGCNLHTSKSIYSFTGFLN